MTQSNLPKNIIVYADDDPDDLDLVKDSFEQFSNNVEVVAFTDGPSVLSWLHSLPSAETSPCLIILDINMPIVSGLQVLVQLRQLVRFEKTPVVLFTTSSQPADRRFAEQYGAGFITKPLDVYQMNRIASQFIDHCSEEIRSRIRRDS